MQLNLVFLEPVEPPTGSQSMCPPSIAWSQIDEAARTAALEKLAILIARMLAERMEEADHE